MSDLLRRRTTRTNPCIYLFCHLLKMMYSARLKIISNHPLMNVNITVYCIMSFNAVYLFIYISDEDFSMIT